MELRLTGTSVIFWDMKFSCFKIGFDGVALMGTSSSNTNKDKVKPNKDKVKPNKDKVKPARNQNQKIAGLTQSLRA